jgi:hypothetical protein
MKPACNGAGIGGVFGSEDGAEDYGRRSPMSNKNS